MKLEYFKSPILFFTIGILLRLVVSFGGWNYDFESWLIVGEISSQTKSFYCLTERYNYGPIWGEILGFFFKISNQKVIFRVFIVILLSLVDIGISIFLRKNYNNNTWLLYLFSPVSIFISGFHNQIDCVSILLVLIGFHFFWRKKASIKTFSIPIFLGLSLVFKHSFIFFPFWLFFYFINKKEWLKSLGPIFSLVIFAISFVFYMECWENIYQNVFKYYSVNNSPFFNLITFNFFEKIEESTKLFKFLFIVSMIISGYLMAKFFSIENLLLFYPLFLVLFSQSITNQYLVIPLFSICILGNWNYWIYTIICTIYLLLDSSGLNLFESLMPNFSSELFRDYFFRILTIFLALVIFSQILIRNRNKFKKIG